MDKTIKIPRVLFLFSKLFLFIGFLFLLHKQLSETHFTGLSLNDNGFLEVGLSLLLMPLNWWFEWRKWEIINESYPYPKDKIWQGFLGGFITAMLTPGLVGNFIGRSFFYNKAKRPQIVLFTLVGNFSQWLITLFFGVLALLILHKSPMPVSFRGVFFTTLVFLILAFLVYLFINVTLRWMTSIFPSLRLSFTVARFYRRKFLFISFCRHVVFSVQFALVMHAFGADWSFHLFAALWQVYLFVTLVPSLFFGKVIIRDTIAVFVLSQLEIGLDNRTIFMASFFVWVINLFIPLMIAIISLKRTRNVD